MKWEAEHKDKTLDYMRAQDLAMGEADGGKNPLSEKEIEELDKAKNIKTNWNQDIRFINYPQPQKTLIEAESTDYIEQV